MSGEPGCAALDREERTGSTRARRLAALLLMVLAAAWIARALAARAEADRSRGVKAQEQLAELEELLAPLERLVPAGEPLRYACPLDAGGRPIAELAGLFDLIQFTLAPRRIGWHVEARFVLAHYDERGDLWTMPDLAGTRARAELAEGLMLLERAGP